MKNIFITGGGGYVGSALSDYLVEQGYKVTAYDLFIYGKNVFSNKRNINLVQGDIRDLELLKLNLKGHDAVIHLACISNDPSFDLNPNLGKSINLDSFEPLVKASREANVKRFIFASSSSVYGINKESSINEDMILKPITDYSKFKAMCEKILLNYKSNNFETVIIRPATVCGFSRRQRLDVIVNILTNLAYHKREIIVFGGEQLRPNIHINDMIRSYLCLLKSETSLVNGEIFNAGWENKSVNEIANLVRSNVGDDVSIVKNISNDNRSYHISSEKIKNVLNFKINFTIENAVKDLVKAFKEKKFLDPLSNELYFNIKRMKNINLK